MLKRVTIVGETAGSGVWHRIDDHFGMGIPETKPINPFSKTDWAETGVESGGCAGDSDEAGAEQATEKVAVRKLKN